MRKSLSVLTAIILCFIISMVAFSQGYPMKGRSAIELNLGIWGGEKVSSTVGTAGVRSEANTTGFTGGLLFAYWFEEQFPLTIDVSMLSGKAESNVGTSGITQQVSSVVAMHIGTRLYIPNPVPETRLRPYLSAAIGAYMGSEAKNTLLTQEAHTENAMGGRLGIGADLILGNNFKIGANINYHLMTDFSTTIGARKNYNGAAFCLMFGIIF